ncbi:hypothetical protein MKZ38_003035 [Zalerion maritima]|uniref:Uncharacterized protein n=1 Tax=Zalerion maritima TaxID=339359 RepID=A0AAD5RUR7_9PEZI|nr:hypothetical protein MKZ38_003035 [Zalerion maritima]
MNPHNTCNMPLPEDDQPQDRPETPRPPPSSPAPVDLGTAPLPPPADTMHAQQQQQQHLQPLCFLSSAQPPPASTLVPTYKNDKVVLALCRALLWDLTPKRVKTTYYTGKILDGMISLSMRLYEAIYARQLLPASDSEITLRSHKRWRMNDHRGEEVLPGYWWEYLAGREDGRRAGGSTVSNAPSAGEGAADAPPKGRGQTSPYFAAVGTAEQPGTTQEGRRVSPELAPHAPPGASAPRPHSPAYAQNLRHHWALLMYLHAQLYRLVPAAEIQEALAANSPWTWQDSRRRLAQKHDEMLGSLLPAAPSEAEKQVRICLELDEWQGWARQVSKGFRWLLALERPHRGGQDQDENQDAGAGDAVVVAVPGVVEEMSCVAEKLFPPSCTSAAYALRRSQGGSAQDNEEGREGQEGQEGHEEEEDDDYGEDDDDGISLEAKISMFTSVQWFPFTRQDEVEESDRAPEMAEELRIVAEGESSTWVYHRPQDYAGWGYGYGSSAQAQVRSQAQDQAQAQAPATASGPATMTGGAGTGAGGRSGSATADAAPVAGQERTCTTGRRDIAPPSTTSHPPEEEKQRKKERFSFEDENGKLVYYYMYVDPEPEHQDMDIDVDMTDDQGAGSEVNLSSDSDWKSDGASMSGVDASAAPGGSTAGGEQGEDGDEEEEEGCERENEK